MRRCRRQPCSRRTRPWRRRSSCRAIICRASRGLIRAIVVNSGCANACTGKAGHAVARRDGRGDRARRSGAMPEEVLVASTGVIGVQLDIDKVKSGVARRRPRCRRAQSDDATRAIMTTDPFPKSHAITVETPHGAFSVGGMAKGSGMIEPRMATMLGLPDDGREDRAGGAVAGAAPRRRTRRSTRSPSTASARRTTACS